MLLHNKGRRSDVGEQYALGEPQLEDIAQVAAVAERRFEPAEYIRPLHGASVGCRERFAETEAAREQHYAQSQQDREDTPPADDAGERSADDRCRHGGYAVDRSDQGEHLGQFAA